MCGECQEKTLMLMRKERKIKEKLQMSDAHGLVLHNIYNARTATPTAPIRAAL